MAVNVTGGELDFVSSIDETSFISSIKNMEGGVSSFTTNLQAQGAQIEAFAAKTASAQNGILERLRGKLTEFKESAEGATSVKSIELFNAKIQDTEKEIARLTNVGKIGFDDMGNAIKTSYERPVGTLNRLIALQKIYQNGSAGMTNPELIEKYNRKLQETEVEIGRVKNIGKIGFDDMGNAVKGSTNILGKLWSGLRLAANILPGIGVAGILAFAVGPIIEYISKLDLFKKALTQLKANIEALNAVQKSANEDAGKQISTLKILYTAATDVTNSTKDRTAAAQELKKEFPQAFANSKLTAILNGEESKTYKQLTADILENARAKAAADKIAEISSKKLDAEFQKQKIASARKSQLGNYADFQKQNEINYKNGSSLLKPGSIQDLDNIKKINDEADKARNAQDKNIKLLNGQEAFLTKFAAGGAKLANVIIGNSNLIKEPLKDFDSLVKNISSKSDIDNIKNALQAELNALAPDDKQIAVYQSKIRKLQEIEKKYAPKLSDGKAAVSADNAIQKQSDALQQKINDINAEYSRKSSTKEDSELQAIRDKFKKIADEAAKFNDDPKNKLHLVDTGKLEDTRDQAIADLQYRQATEKTKIELEKQKSLYAEYEDYKTSLGKEAADERFKSELTYVTYLQKLEAERAKLLDKHPTHMTGAELERLEDYDKRIAEEVKSEKKKYNALVKEFISYSDERKALTEKYQSDIAQMEAKGADTTARTKAYQEKLNSLDDEKAQSLDAYKALFKGIDQLSDENAKKVIANAQTMLESLVGKGKISKDLAEEIAKMIKSTDVALRDRMPDRLINLARQIDQVADAVSGVDEGFGKMLHTLGNVVGQVGNIKKGMLDMKAAQSNGDVLGQLGSGLGIFTAGFSIISSIAKQFDNSARRQEQQAYATENQAKQNEALNKALERQISLIDKAYGTDRLLKYAEAQAKITENEEKYTAQLGKKLQLTGTKYLDDMITNYNNTGDSKYLGFAKDQSQLDFLKLPIDDIKKLTDLIGTGKLDAGTEKLVQNLIDAQEASKELKNNLKAETIGTSLDSIADSFVDALRGGTKDFGKTFEEIIKTSILNGFKGQLIEKQLQPFYDKFAEFSKDGLTEAEIAKLQKMRDQILIDGQKEIDNLEKVTGVDLSKKNGGLESSGITASQESVDINNAIARSNYEQLKQQGLTLLDHLQVARQGIDYLNKIDQNTYRTANNTDSIPAKLDQIITNTKPTPKGQGWQAVGG